MIVGTDILERQILLVTSQEGALAPIVAVIKTILQQMPSLVTPHSAIATAEIQRFDLVIIDVHCQDSLPLIKKFKENFVYVPIVAMVPYGNVNIVEQVLENGADDYISQPIALERLKTTLRNALRMRAMLLGMEHSGHGNGHSGTRHSHSSMFLDATGRIKPLREIEDAVIEYTIASCQGCITQAARTLGVGRSTLYRKMQVISRAQTSRENHTTRPMMLASSIGDS